MLIVDTGVFLAAADLNDPNHKSCAGLLSQTSGPLITTWLVVAETTYLLSRRLDGQAEVMFLRSISGGEIRVEDLLPEDVLRMVELTETYAGFPLGAADASVIALAERHGQTTVATLDHRHFGAIKPMHTPGFELVPLKTEM